MEFMNDEENLFSVRILYFKNWQDQSKTNMQLEVLWLRIKLETPAYLMVVECLTFALDHMKWSIIIYNEINFSIVRILQSDPSWALKWQGSLWFSNMLEETSSNPTKAYSDDRNFPSRTILK